MRLCKEASCVFLCHSLDRKSSFIQLFILNYLKYPLFVICEQVYWILCKTARNYKCRIILLFSAFLLWCSECFTSIILLSLLTSLGGRGILQAIMDCFAESAQSNSIMISLEKIEVMY